MKSLAVTAAEHIQKTVTCARRRIALTDDVSMAMLLQGIASLIHLASLI